MTNKLLALLAASLMASAGCSVLAEPDMDASAPGSTSMSAMDDTADMKKKKMGEMKGGMGGDGY